MKHRSILSLRTLSMTNHTNTSMYMYSFNVVSLPLTTIDRSIVPQKDDRSLTNANVKRTRIGYE